MRPVNDKLALEILEAGKKEFLDKGYEKAALRNIAASLGVTTGAIYRYYRDKEALFDSIVKEPAEELLNQYKEIQHNFSIQPLQQQLDGLSETAHNGHDWMFHLIYDHFDSFKLIACCAGGTNYEHYIDQLVEVEVETSLILMEKMEKKGMKFQRIEEELIHILANAMFQGMFETVRHDMPRNQAEQYFIGLREFYEAGWNHILGLS